MLTRSTDVVARKIDGETILVHVRGKAADLEEIFLLNETGAAIWDLRAWWTRRP